MQSNLDFADAHINLGAALARAGRHDAALESYDRAIALQPGSAHAWSNRGLVLAGTDRHEAALENFARALALEPDLAEAHYNQGKALADSGRPEAALQSYERAIAFDPGHADACYNRAIILGDLMRHEEALESYERAIEVNPGHSGAQLNLALCRLILGDFSRGWPAYEWRRLSPDARAAVYAAPAWLGEETLAGKTILLHAEQGLGDTLQFCRYAKQVSALGAHVVLEVQKPLKDLLANLEGVDHLIARGEPIPRVDYQTPLLSLPLAFKTTLDTIPAVPKGFGSAPALIERWRGRLGPKSLPRIGLVWKAGTEARSVPLAGMLGLVSGNHQFFALQTEVSAADREILDSRKDFLHLTAGLRNFADAPLVELMDLVITADTSMAHLAGALGKPVWVLLPFNPDSRWMLGRPDSPWYPTVRLFRQPAPGDWGSVLGRVSDALKGEFGTHRRTGSGLA